MGCCGTGGAKAVAVSAVDPSAKLWGAAGLATKPDVAGIAARRIKLQNFMVIV